MSMTAASSPTVGPTMTRGSGLGYDLSKRCNSAGGSLPGFRMGIKDHYPVQILASIQKIPAEEIMKDRAPQGTCLEGAVLAQLQVVYTPPSGQRARSWRASSKPMRHHAGMTLTTGSR